MFARRARVYMENALRNYFHSELMIFSQLHDKTWMLRPHNSLRNSLGRNSLENSLVLYKPSIIYKS